MLPSVPSRSVRQVINQDGAVLLDLEQGICLSLNPVAATIWKQLALGQSPAQIGHQLCAEFNVPESQVRQDIATLLDNLRQKGLLVSTTQNPRSCRLRWPISLVCRCRSYLRGFGNRSKHLLLWKALAGFLLFDLLGLSDDFPSVYAFVRSWYRSSRPSTVDPERVCAAINLACVWYPKQVLCLQRSTVTTCLLRSCGIPAQMVLGAQKFPFQAHAWTEVSGRPINERRDVHTYIVWEKC